MRRRFSLAYAQPRAVRRVMTGLARRFYLRLLSRDGRTIAVYSDFYHWRVSNWIDVDESTIRIRQDRVIDAEARFAGLSPEQSEAIAS